MKERPILFNGEMVRALLDGRKTETRRPINYISGSREFVSEGLEIVTSQQMLTRRPANAHFILGPGRCPFGDVGDRLWVRETFVLENTDDVPDGVPRQIEPGEWGTEIFPHYRATEPEPHIVPAGLEDPYDDRTRWQPAIFMPRWACRIVLEITGIDVQRLQDMGENAAIAEGVIPATMEHHLTAFVRSWDALYAKRGYGWDANPLVWIITFRRTE